MEDSLLHKQLDKGGLTHRRGSRHCTQCPALPAHMQSTVLTKRRLARLRTPKVVSTRGHKESQLNHSKARNVAYQPVNTYASQ